MCSLPGNIQFEHNATVESSITFVHWWSLTMTSIFLVIQVILVVSCVLLQFIKMNEKGGRKWIGRSYISTVIDGQILSVHQVSFVVVMDVNYTLHHQKYIRHMNLEKPTLDRLHSWNDKCIEWCKLNVNAHMDLKLFS